MTTNTYNKSIGNYTKEADVNYYDDGHIEPAIKVIEQTDIFAPEEQKTSVLEIYGYIWDNNTAQAVDAFIQVVDDSTEEPLSEKIRIPPNDYYYAYTPMAKRFENSIVFSADGYTPKKIQFAKLETDSDVYLDPIDTGKKFPWAILLVIVAAAVLTYRKKSGKMGALSTADLFPIFMIAGGLIAFSVIKKILETLGLWADKDTKELDEEATDPNSFWNPNFWRTVLRPGQTYSYAIDSTTALRWSEELYNCFGAFNDNEDQAIAIFKRCRTQANASFISYTFEQRYQEDLLTFLRGGWWPQDRLSDEDVNVINRYIQNLPKY